MPLIYSEKPLSAAPLGLPIAVTATASPGQIIHTVQVTATTGIEQITVGAVSRSTASMPLTIEFGSTASDNRFVTFLVDAQSVATIIPKLRLTGTDSIVRAYSSGTATGAISVFGTIERAS